MGMHKSCDSMHKSCDSMHKSCDSMHMHMYCVIVCPVATDHQHHETSHADSVVATVMTLISLFVSAES